MKTVYGLLGLNCTWGYNLLIYVNLHGYPESCSFCLCEDGVSLQVATMSVQLRHVYTKRKSIQVFSDFVRFHGARLSYRKMSVGKKPTMKDILEYRNKMMNQSLPMHWCTYLIRLADKYNGRK